MVGEGGTQSEAEGEDGGESGEMAWSCWGRERREYLGPAGLVNGVPVIRPQLSTPAGRGEEDVGLCGSVACSAVIVEARTGQVASACAVPHILFFAGRGPSELRACGQMRMRQRCSARQQTPLWRRVALLFPG